MTISERVLAYLKEQPGTMAEIGEALGLHKRGWAGYNFGRWSFVMAEDEGIIEWIDGKWHLKEAEA